jgi:alpha-tubulin suppressor-like RCC1 family protein
MWHSGAVVDGQVLLWGKGKGGRLGLGDEEMRTAPTVVADIAGVHSTP